jgi:hypothetical protein
MAEGLRNPVVCRDDEITRLVPMHLLTVREAIRAALANIERHCVETSWSMAGPIPGDPDWAGGAVFCDRRDPDPVGLARPHGIKREALRA